MATLRYFAFTLLAAISLLLCAGIVTVWAFSPADLWIGPISFSFDDGQLGFFAYRTTPQPPLRLGIPYWILILVFLWVPTLWLGNRHYGLPTRRREKGLCAKCGYNLTGNISGVCPECGAAVRMKSEASVPILPCPVCSSDLIGDKGGVCRECGTTLGASAPRRSAKDLGADVPQLNARTYESFIRSNRVVAILFDAPAWDFGGWTVMSALVPRAALELGKAAAWGFVDVDGAEEAPMARSIPVANVPCVAYYREGKLIAALVGQGQDVVSRVRAVADGKPIGHKDGRILRHAEIVRLCRANPLK